MNTLSLNVGNFDTLKLSPTSYPLWREQALALVESQDLLGHLNKEETILYTIYYTNTKYHRYFKYKTLELELTEAFATWQKSDRLLHGWIIGTLSKEALGLML